ncbi:helix-turn-helix transcriptional regulator [Butyrivibrio sp. VCB2001]|uniref:helix-turn-helix transcriptional regulator n=1 Tax=Butyrivibrio sp. VCB2001 TaxID=1280667 RepID=UPI00040ADF2A|nr:WYL domain-containing protein [Butyrivibrio sp. VCB2001]
MGTKQSKKLMLFNLLDILRKYTDEDHRLSQKEIEERLKEEYDMTADRKSIKTNLMNLEEFGYEIAYSESIRMVKNPKTGELEENYILSDFYLVRDFEDSELRLLIDGLLFSKHLPYSQCKELVEKIEKLSNIYFRSRVKHIATMPKDRTNNKQLFYNIDVIDEAINEKKKIAFKYVEYGTDLKQHPKKDDNGKDRVYVVSPYQMAAKEGKYYLICNYDQYEDISNYRVDRIVDIEKLDETAKSFSKLKGANGQALDLSKYMKEHVYMYSSDTSRAKLRIVNAMISDIVDMFGSDVRFYDQDDTHVSVAVNANETSVLQFAKNYAPDVVILEPKELRDRAIEDLKKGLKGYEQK